MLFGLGAPKAGTSWQHGYLAAHPEVFVPPIKEMHYFNSVDGDASRRLRRLARKHHRAAEMQAAGEAPEVSADQIAEIRALIEVGSEQDYLDYMRREAGDQKVVADITPAYGLLSLERLRSMQAMANSRFVYLMRDPVARMWSNIRMNAVRKIRKGDDRDLATICKALFKNAMKGNLPDLQQRNDYASVLTKIAKLDPKRVLIAFYEELFTNETVTRICDFLEIAVMPADLSARINEGTAVQLADADRTRAAAYLKPQYAAVQAHMGRLPDAWKQNAGVA